MSFSTFTFRFLKRVWRTRLDDVHPIGVLLLKIALTLFGPLLRVEGAARLEQTGAPAIFAANHNNYLETIILPCVLLLLTGRKVTFFVHWMFKDFPFIGWLVRFIDPIWVWTKSARFTFGRRQRPPEENHAVNEAVRRFRSGVSLGIFPEGTRNHHPHELLKSRRGLGEIALRCGGPVIPVGIDFTRRIALGKIPALGQMIIRFGPRLDLEDELAHWKNAETNPDRAAARHALADLSRSVNDRAMRAIAGLCGKRYLRFRQGGHEDHEEDEG
jgi:1-acyl-sn-glycerol-3-phosphate acyltransferase